MFEIKVGDSEVVLSEMDPESIDAVVTDPPYGLSKEPDIEVVLSKWESGETHQHTHSGFMGKSWDSFVPNPGLWKEVNRALKPGGYVFAFAGSRTQGLMTTSMEFGGFKILRQLFWVYKSGFPKSLDVSKAVEKMSGVDSVLESEIASYLERRRIEIGLSKSEVDKSVFGGSTRYAFVVGRTDANGVPKIYLPTPTEWGGTKTGVRY